MVQRFQGLSDRRPAALDITGSGPRRQGARGSTGLLPKAPGVTTEQAMASLLSVFFGKKANRAWIGLLQG